MSISNIFFSLLKMIGTFSTQMKKWKSNNSYGLWTKAHSSLFHSITDIHATQFQVLSITFSWLIISFYCPTFFSSRIEIKGSLEYSFILLLLLLLFTHREERRTHRERKDTKMRKLMCWNYLALVNN